MTRNCLRLPRDTSDGVPNIRYMSDADKLKTFDPARRCPKCGGFARVRHERMMGYDTMRLIRRCVRCDYFWRELPLDYPPHVENPCVTQAEIKGLRRRVAELENRKWYSRFFSDYSDW